MDVRKLGNSGVEISRFVLGTMEFGARVAEAEAFEQLDTAFENGVTTLDTAEIYPAPATAECYGESERIVGRWLISRGLRSRLVVATKCAGPGAFVPWVRGGCSRHTAANLSTAVEGSLRRLGIEALDLVQLHWPDRASNFFGQRGFKVPRDELPFDIEATARALGTLVRSGKVRAVGVCNETPWGISALLAAARAEGLPGVASVQNPYNLLNRGIEGGIAEFAWRESIGLLSYSPLAGGLLTAKYHDGRAADGDRLNSQPHYRRYKNARALDAAARYDALARDAGLDAAHMALAWVASKPTVTGVIIGATSAQQLTHNLKAHAIELPRELVRRIDAVHEEIPDPCP